MREIEGVGRSGGERLSVKVRETERDRRREREREKERQRETDRESKIENEIKINSGRKRKKVGLRMSKKERAGEKEGGIKNE